MNKNMRIQEKMCIKSLDKKKVLFKSKLEQMEIAYHNNGAKRVYQEVKSIRKGFQPQTSLIRDKVGDTVSNKEKALQMGLIIIRSTSNC
jgi:hypothetical protein